MNTEKFLSRWRPEKVNAIRAVLPKLLEVQKRIIYHALTRRPMPGAYKMSADDLERIYQDYRKAVLGLPGVQGDNVTDFRESPGVHETLVALGLDDDEWDELGEVLSEEVWRKALAAARPWCEANCPE